MQKIGFSIFREGRRHTLLHLGKKTIAIPRHARDLPTGTFHAILKQAGLDVAQYLRLR